MDSRKAVCMLVLTCLLAGVSMASDQAKWIDLGSKTEQKAEVRAISAKSTGVALEATLWGVESIVLNSGMVGNEKERFAQITIPGYAHTGEIGKPKMPMVTAVLDVPIGATVTVNVTSNDYSETDLNSWGIGQRIVPALASVEKKEGARPIFVFDAQTYSTDAFYPGRLTEVMDNSKNGGLARGHRLVTITFYPVQYNPASGKIRYYRNLKAQVTFTGGDPAKTKAGIMKDYSRDWEDNIRRLVVNYDENQYKAVQPLPIYYDIYYGTVHAAAAQKLGDWKSKTGYKVRMKDVSGWTYARLNDTCRLRSPLATYQIIISDPNGTNPIPSGTATAYTGQTDLYYAETNESGYVPDMFFARLPVKDASEADIAVTKVINYEKANFGSAGTAWLKRALLIAGYDATYQWMGVATNEYSRQILQREGYTTIDTLIQANGEGKARVVPRINAGRAWSIYTAHGGETCWCLGGTYWYATELNGDLTNLDMYTLPMAHCCVTGDFDYSSGDCFGETWAKLANKGGVSYFGSVTNSLWDEDDWLQRRYFDAIYDSVAGTPNLKLTEIGRFTQYSLNWMNNNTSSSNKQYYLETYHVFNDPSMDFWTDVPKTLTVTHNPFIPPSAGTFSVQVYDGGTPLQNALVGLWCKTQSTMHLSGYTDVSGSITLAASPTIANDTMWVTVTKHNYDPYEGYAIVRANGAYVTKLKHTINDASGNNDGIINPGETVRMPTWVKNAGTVATNGPVVSRLRSASPNVTLLDTSYTYSALAAGDSGQHATGYQFTASASCTNGVALPFVLMCRDNDSTWNTSFSLMVGTPVLGYNGRVINGNGRLDPSKASKMAVGLKNDGAGYSYSTEGVLRCNNGLISITDSTASYGTINPSASGTSGTDSFTVNCGAVPVGTVVTFTIVMRSTGVSERTANWTETIGDIKYSVTPDNSTPSAVYYAVEDSDGVDRAPVYSWVEIRSLGTQLTALNTDDATAAVTLPFTFKWYGTGYTTLSVCSNGWVSFGSNTSTAYSNTVIPSSTFATPTIFMNWDDLTGSSTGAWVGYYYDTANRRFIVEYDSIATLSGGARHKFQLILYDSTGTGTKASKYYDAVVQYQILTPGTSSSIGFQRSSTVGAQELYNGVYAATMLPLGANRAVRLTGTPSNPLGVTFANMSAQSTAKGIELIWRTESELDCYQWEIERSQQSETGYQMIGQVDGQGTTSQATDYRYTDGENLFPGGYYYRLNEIDGSGGKTSYGPMFVQVGGRELPLNYELGQSRPNPSRGKVSISFALKKAGKTSLTIYNITGQAVRRLEGGELPAGYHTRSWDGRDMQGQAVTNGVYFYKLSSGEYNAVNKLTILR